MSASSDPRLLIATATRALAVAGLFDHNGHISVRDGDHIWINSRQASRIGARPEDVAHVRIADGHWSDLEPPSETALHLAAYRARPDVGSASHFHPLYATAFAVAGRPLVTAYCAGSVFGSAVPVFDDPDLIRSDDQGRDLVAVWGSHDAVLLRGHGVAVVGTDVPDCARAAVFLEESARRLAVTVPLGEPRAFTAEEVRRVRETLMRRSVVLKTWTDLLERARRAGALSDLPPLPPSGA